MAGDVAGPRKANRLILTIICLLKTVSLSCPTEVVGTMRAPVPDGGLETAMSGSFLVVAAQITDGSAVRCYRFVTTSAGADCPGVQHQRSCRKRAPPPVELPAEVAAESAAVIA